MILKLEKKTYEKELVLFRTNEQHRTPVIDESSCSTSKNYSYPSSQRESRSFTSKHTIDDYKRTRDEKLRWHEHFLINAKQEEVDNEVEPISIISASPSTKRNQTLLTSTI